MRRVLFALPLVLDGCTESQLEQRVPEQVWQDRPTGPTPQEGPLEATYRMSPVPAVVDPAPVPRERPRSISLGYVGDAPLTETPVYPPHWPYVQEPFHYREPYGGRRYGYGRGHWVRVPRYAQGY